MSDAPTSRRLVCFNHGKESGPWGTKIRRLAEIATARGFAVMSPDYSHTPDPDARVRQLLATPMPDAEILVIVGSSMGGYVAAQACSALRPRALLLMVPALYFPGWENEPTDIPADTVVVHGWGDTVVPLERSLRFATRHRAALHVFDADHGLSAALEDIAMLFDRQLARVCAASAGMTATGL